MEDDAADGSFRLGKLKLGKILGKGSFALVQAGQQGDKEVAIKVLHQHLRISPAQLKAATAQAKAQGDSAQGDPEVGTSLIGDGASDGDTAFKLFCREALVMAKLEHRALVKCYGVHQLPHDYPGLIIDPHEPHTGESRWCMVLERCMGDSLAKVISSQMTSASKVYTTRDVLSWLHDIAEGMAHLHDQHPCIIHRDLKCENVLLKTPHKKNARVPVLVTDLGLHVRVGSKRQRQLRRVSAAGSLASVSNTDFMRAASMTGACPGSKASGAHADAFIGVPTPNRQLTRTSLACDSALSTTQVYMDQAMNQPVFITATQAEEEGLEVPDDLCAAPGAGRTESDWEVPTSAPSMTGRRRADMALMSMIAQASASQAPSSRGECGTNPQSLGDMSVAADSRPASPGPDTSFLDSATLLGNSVGPRKAELEQLIGLPSLPLPGSPSSLKSHHSFNGVLPPIVSPGSFSGTAPFRPPSRLGALPQVSVSGLQTAGSSGLSTSVRSKASASGRLTNQRSALSPGSPGSWTEGKVEPSASSESMRAPSPLPFAIEFARHSLTPASPKTGNRRHSAHSARPMPNLITGLASHTSDNVSNPPASPKVRFSISDGPADKVRFSVPDRQDSGGGCDVAKPAPSFSVRALHRPSMAQSVAASDWGEVLEQLNLGEGPEALPLNGLARSVMKHLTPEELAWVYSLTGGTGSALYMAPEVQRREPYNEKIDVFSFGVIAYELLSRSLLMFSHLGTSTLPGIETPEDYAALVATGYRPTKPRCVGNVEEQLWELVCRCWSQDPNMRPSMQDVALLLEVMAEEEATNAPSQKEKTAAGGACCTIM